LMKAHLDQIETWPVTVSLDHLCAGVLGRVLVVIAQLRYSV